MASILEYFNNDFKELSLDKILHLSEDNIDKRIVSNHIEVKQRIRQDTYSSTRMFTYYIPKVNYTFGVCIGILQELERFKNEASSVNSIIGFKNDLTAGVHTSIYSNRIYIYSEDTLSKSELFELDKFCKVRKLYVTFRSQLYRKTRMELEKPLAFISHDSNDKSLIARDLALGLSSRLCTVWYDEYSLKVGDSLRESIEQGIKEAHKCILILTPNFLSNTGWSKKEFDSIFTREMIMNERIIIPVWYNVTDKEIYEYSPALANKVALEWPNPTQLDKEEYKKQVQQVVSKIHTEITSSNKN